MGPKIGTDISAEDLLAEWDEPSGVRSLFDDITPTKPIAPELLAELSARDEPFFRTQEGGSSLGQAHHVPTIDELGGLRAIAHQALLPGELSQHALDPRAAFIVSLADGATTIEDMLDLCGMPQNEALLILGDLAERRILHFEDP